MSKIYEALKSIRTYKNIGEQINPVAEFTRVLRQTVQEDLSQADQIFGEEKQKKPLLKSMMYAQRAIELGYIFSEIFVKEEYRNWHVESDSPRIIDLGGDPGAMTVLYWKHRVPDARITVVEANPATVNVMRQSVTRRGFEDIQIINAAVVGNAEKNALLYLHKPRKGYHTQDYVENNRMNELSSYVVEVPNVVLSSLINKNEQIDLLKNRH